MEDTGSILFCLFKKNGMEERLVLARLQRDWQGMFDGPLALHTFPAALNKSILLINVDSPQWLQQLKFFKQAMLKKLEAFKIKGIDFRHGRTRLPCPDSARPESTIPDTACKLSDADCRWIESAVMALDDDGLREQIKRTMEKSLLRKV